MTNYVFNFVCCADSTPKRINDLNTSMKNNYLIIRLNSHIYIYIHTHTHTYLFYLYNLNF